MSRDDTIFGDDWPFSKAKSTLLKSAAIVMREQGPRSATLKNIAVRAGVTEPAIFRHFEGVDGMFQSLYMVVELFYGQFAESFKNTGLTGLDRLDAGLEKILTTIKSNAEFAYIIAKPDPVFRQYPKLKAQVDGLDESLKAAVMECLKEAKSAGQLVPGVELDPFATAVIGALYRVLYSWLDDVDAGDPRKDGKKVFAGLFVLARKPGTELNLPKIKPGKKK